MTVLIIEHAQGRAEGLSDEAIKYNTAFYIWKAYEGTNLQRDISDFEGVIVGGGPMGVYELEKYPFFKPELQLIEGALIDNIPLFGICLGAQILAQMLGCKVEKTFWRRGYLTIRRTSEGCADPLLEDVIDSFPTFQYHQDEILEIPTKATLILTSDNCRVEGFRLDDKPVWAIQSHPEIGKLKAESILNSAYTLKPEEVSQMLSMSSHEAIGTNSILFRNFFNILKNK